MRVSEGLLTSESVCPGHPDKICDQISDALVDLYLSQDPSARLGIEAVVSTQRVILLGEVSSNATISRDQREAVVRHLIQTLGYDQSDFNWQTCHVEDYIHAQSPDIAQGVITGGAGDQGFMFGYACDETPTFMPAPLYYAHHLLSNLQQAQNAGRFPLLGPDGKAQICVQYKQGRPMGIRRLVLSKQHLEAYTLPALRQDLLDWMSDLFPKDWLCSEDHIYINPTGRFVIGGPTGDTGLTGRKIIVDTYGGASPHGGGAFSGKDGTKVDRSAAYMMRYLAKNIVAAGLAQRCTLQVSYSIGRADPLSFLISTHGTGRLADDLLTKTVRSLVDLTPQGLIKTLTLQAPCYQPTATFGHFGRDPTSEGLFPWEKTDLVPSLFQTLKPYL